VNKRAAEAWEDEAVAAINADGLMARAQADGYSSGTCPEGVVLLLMAVDVQDTWLETTVWGFGRGEEMWRIWHQKVEGSPAYDDVWQQIDSIRKTQWPREGGGVISVHRALRMGHAAAVKAAPTEVTVYRLTYASADDPFDVTAQHTYTTHTTRGTFSPQSAKYEPAAGLGERGAVVTLNRAALGFVPSQYDRLGIGGVFYNVVEAHDVEAAVVRLVVRGPAPDPTTTGDVSAPNRTGHSASPNTLSADYTATFNEAVHWRIRWQQPAGTGLYTTGTWNESSYESSVAFNLAPLELTTVRCEIQARDAAGNVSRWFVFDTVTPLPEVAS